MANEFRGKARVAFGAALISLTLCAVADAQAPGSNNYRLQLDQIRREQILQASPQIPPEQRAFVDYGAYLTSTYLSVDDNLQDNHVLRQFDFINYLRLNFDNANELLLRFRISYHDYNKDDSFDGRGDGFDDPDFDLAYYRFDLAKYLGAYKGKEIDSDISVKIGRDIVYWGNGLALGQQLDGVQLALSKGAFELDAIGGVTPVRTVDFETSRPDFDFNTRRGYFGALASVQAGSHRPFVYALLQQDYNKYEASTLGTVTTRYGYDSFYLGLGSSGNLGDRVAYGAEMVYEGGYAKSNSFTASGPFLTPVPQTKEDICAYAADLHLDYLVPDVRRTRWSTEMLLSSGDNDRQNSINTFAGNKSHTNDNAYNAFTLINTGQSFAPSVSNLLMLRVGVSTYPFADTSKLKRLQLGMDLFAYGRMSTAAPIDEPLKAGADNRFLGWEPDFYLNWQLTSDVTLAMRYGVFFPDSGAFANSDARQFFSTSVTFSF